MSSRDNAMDEFQLVAQNPAVIAADWLGFVMLLASSAYLALKLNGFKGPDRDDKYFFGYHEEKMMSVYVNLFASLAYWARICSHANGDVGGAAQFQTYKYLDYLITCPLLTIDLLWSLNLPYKFSYGTNVFVCIICAVCAEMFAAPARYMWFALGVSLFAFTWYSIISIVRQRLDQFVSSVAKKVRASLKIAVMTYFSIWCGYPTLWLLLEIGVVGPVASLVMHAVLDVLAKSVYGLFLLQFQLGGEKHEFIFAPLKPAIEEKDIGHEDSDSEGSSSGTKVKQSTVIGGKHRKRDSTANPSPSIIGGWPNPNPLPNRDAEVSNTMGEIQDIQAQLQRLMTVRSADSSAPADSPKDSSQPWHNLTRGGSDGLRQL